jgi:predicted CXXCH cytochrome family protein
VFPLNDDGKIYCGTCHTAHGVSWSQRESPVFMRVNNVDSRLCLACHLDQSTGPAEGNHPLFKKPQHSSRQLKQSGAKFAKDGTVICQSCHQPHGAPAKKMLVMKNTQSELCQNCHSDKREVRGSKHDMALMAPKAKNNNGDTAAETGTCGACHVPHNGKGPALWARERVQGVPPEAASCIGCHQDEGLAHKKTPGTHSHPVGDSIAEAGIRVVKGEWKSSSPLVSKDKPLQPLPLYDKRGLRHAKGTNVGCGSCNYPHKWQPGAPNKNLTNPKKLAGNNQSSFLRIAGDANSTLCTNCHVDKRAVLLSRHNPYLNTDKKSADKSSKASRKKKAPKDTAHSTTSNTCRSCHTPHNAKAANLWARKLDKSVTGVAALCGDCHRKGGTAETKLTGLHSHPLGKEPKGKPKNNLPLFDAKGKRVKHGGGVDCASCHDLHQWDPKNPLSTAGTSTSVEGDASNSFLRDTVAGDSALCVNCHADQRWVHNTEHDMRVSASNSTNKLGQTTKESGPCGQCHVPHNAADSARIWARTLGEGEDKLEQQCRSCHRDKGVAAAKQPLSTTHPEEVTVWSGEIRKRYGRSADTSLPVYDQHGKPGPTGKITCATCHEPHQWSGAARKMGPGKNIEGTIDNSFLRLRNSENSRMNQVNRVVDRFQIGLSLIHGQE